MSKARDERDEFEHIMDSMRIDFRTPEELEAAVSKARNTIYEACSEQDVAVEDYKATREKCLRDIMKELGQNPMFNDIMDVVAVTQMIREKPGGTISMFDRENFPNGAQGVFKPQKVERQQSQSNLNVTANIYDYAIGEIIEHGMEVHAGQVHLAAATGRSALRGVIIHEFAHFAMYAVFKNDCNPYTDSDTEAQKKFSAITKQTMDNLYLHFFKRAPGSLTPSWYDFKIKSINFA
jgi:hypothetical protein